MKTRTQYVIYDDVKGLPLYYIDAENKEICLTWDDRAEATKVCCAFNLNDKNTPFSVRPCFSFGK